MDFDSAIAAHAEWKIRFRQAIAAEAFLDERSIGADNCCELGKWLHGDAKRLLVSSEALEDCIVKHARFHGEAARIASAVNNRQFDRAEQLLADGGVYAAFSEAVLEAIQRLKDSLQEG